MGHYPELNLLMVMRIVVAIPLYCGKMCHYDSLNKKLNSLQLGRDFWTERSLKRRKVESLARHSGSRMRKVEMR